MSNDMIHRACNADTILSLLCIEFKDISDSCREIMSVLFCQKGRNVMIKAIENHGFNLVFCIEYKSNIIKSID